MPSDTGARSLAIGVGANAGLSGQVALAAISPQAVIVELCIQVCAAIVDDYSAACVRRNRYEHSGRAPTPHALADYVATLHDSKSSTEGRASLMVLVEWLIDVAASHTAEAVGLGIGIYYSIRNNTQTVRRAIADDAPLPQVTDDEIRWTRTAGRSTAAAIEFLMAAVHHSRSQ